MSELALFTLTSGKDAALAVVPYWAPEWSAISPFSISHVEIQKGFTISKTNCPYFSKYRLYKCNPLFLQLSASPEKYCFSSIRAIVNGDKGEKIAFAALLPALFMATRR